jgi:hypothetical protein
VTRGKIRPFTIYCIDYGKMAVAWIKMAMKVVVRSFMFGMYFINSFFRICWLLNIGQWGKQRRQEFLECDAIYWARKDWERNKLKEENQKRSGASWWSRNFLHLTPWIGRVRAIKKRLYLEERTRKRGPGATKEGTEKHGETERWQSKLAASALSPPVGRGSWSFYHKVN